MELSVRGVAPLDVKVLSSNIDVVNPSVKQQLHMTGVGEKRTVIVRPVSKEVGTSLLRFVLTDANGATASAELQIDVILEKQPSAYQKWKEKMKGKKEGMWRL